MLNDCVMLLTPEEDAVYVIVYEPALALVTVPVIRLLDALNDNPVGNPETE